MEGAPVKGDRRRESWGRSVASPIFPGMGLFDL